MPPQTIPDGPPRVPPYYRISDTDDERAPGIDRQGRIVVPLIERNGGEIPFRDMVDGKPRYEYVDNDKSAFDPTVYRDDFEAWLQDFIDDKHDGGAAYDLDRFFRQPKDLERVIEAYCRAWRKGNGGRRKPVLWVGGMTIDLTDPDGQYQARSLVAAAAHQSGKTSKRTDDKYRDSALQGKIYTNYPAFYRNPDGTINAAKGAIALKAVDDVLAGVRPTTIAAEWRHLGITAARGGRPQGSTVRRILTAPGIAGLSVYRDDLLEVDGKPVPRTDVGLIDEVTWRAVCAKLVTTPGRRNRSATTLLSKKARCGNCGSKMVRRPRNDSWFSYNCRSKDSGGCGNVAISGPQLDKQVTKLVLDYLARPVPPAEEKPFPGQARLDEVIRLKDELMEAWHAGKVPGSAVWSEITRLDDEKQTLLNAAAAHVKQRRRMTTAPEEWSKLDLERKQAIIDEIFEAIVIMPATGKPGVYDPQRVRLVWRSTE